MAEFNYKVPPQRARNTQVEFQQVSGVPKNTETTVLSFTNSGTKLWIEAIGGTGTTRAEWNIYINTVLTLTRRTSTADPVLELPMYDFPMANGDIIDIKVIQPYGATQDFDSDVRYFR